MTAPNNEHFIYVQDGSALEDLIRKLAAAARVAVDTEADSLHNYFEKVCLIQLSFAGAHYLVDPLCGLDLALFLEALAEKALILHGGDYDLRMLRQSTGFRPRGEIFDTMIAAQLLGIEQIGLAALIERHFNVTIAKEGQKSDWSRRPLSAKQLHYAVTDTKYLEVLADRMTDELDARGRLAWHQESCRAMVESTARDRERDPDDVWRLKGAGRLSRRQLAYLKELWLWRDQLARQRNRPPFHIFGNQQIFDLLLWAEAHPGAPLDQGVKLPRNIHGPLRDSLEAALGRAATMPAAKWPERKMFERPSAPPADFADKLTALRDECARIAKELEIAPATLAPRAAVEALVRSRPQAIEEIMATGGLLRWQAELIQGAVVKCLHGIS